MIGIYIRLSQEDEESNSIENQLFEGKKFAIDKKEPFLVYNEGQGVSGANLIQDRPVFQNLLKDIKEGKVTTVWARNQNRISRSRMVFAEFLNVVNEHSVNVYFNDIKYDLDDPTAKLILGIFNEFNSYQVELQSQQTKKALLNNAKEGKAFGITPYGYDNVDGYLHINDEEAEVVKRIYDLSLNGTGTRSIAEILNDEEIPTRYNKIGEGTLTFVHKDTGKKTTKKKSDIRWAGNTIRNIITNTIFKGERLWKGETIELPSLKILEPHYWQKVNDNLVNNYNTKGKKVDHKYMLKGVLECFECGRNYYGRTRQNKKDNYYMCSSKRYKHETCTNRSINIDVLESFIWESLFEGDGMYEKMVQTYKEGGTEKRRNELAKLIEKNKKKLEALDGERKRMINALVKGLISEGDFKDEKTRIIRTENDLKEHLKKDREEYATLDEENKVLEDIAFDWGFLNKESYDSLMKPGKEKLRAELKEHITLKRRKRKFNPPWNEKKRIIKKYIKRILIEHDNDNKLYILTVKYNLPIQDETYLIDNWYLYGYDHNKKKMTKWLWEGNTRKFTASYIMQTNKRLKEYFN
ncbi:recombinase family protein [Maribacter sp. 2210JD10-5]|uniref:recombinase family protein n=1 Tax=Maribacter sp. 2210JD10-5 TaxID=3386272 RepID=UPI0039BD7BBB